MQNGAAVFPPVAQEVWRNWFITYHWKSTSSKLWLLHLPLQQALYFCAYNIAIYFRGNNSNVIICIHNQFTVTRKGKPEMIILKKLSGSSWNSKLFKKTQNNYVNFSAIISWDIELSIWFLSSHCRKVACRTEGQACVSRLESWDYRWGNTQTLSFVFYLRFANVVLCFPFLEDSNYSGTVFLHSTKRCTNCFYIPG